MTRLVLLILLLSLLSCRQNETKDFATFAKSVPFIKTPFDLMYSSQLNDSLTFRDTTSCRLFLNNSDLLITKLYETNKDFTFLIYDPKNKKAFMKIFDMKGAELVKREINIDICQKDDFGCDFMNEWNKTVFLDKRRIVFCDTSYDKSTDKEGNEIVVIIAKCDTFNIADRQ